MLKEVSISSQRSLFMHV